jgi:hypothetical protein
MVTKANGQNVQFLNSGWEAGRRLQVAQQRGLQNRLAPLWVWIQVNSKLQVCKTRTQQLR